MARNVVEVRCQKTCISDVMYGFFTVLCSLSELTVFTGYAFAATTSKVNIRIVACSANTAEAAAQPLVMMLLNLQLNGGNDACLVVPACGVKYRTVCMQVHIHVHFTV